MAALIPPAIKTNEQSFFSATIRQSLIIHTKSVLAFLPTWPATVRLEICRCQAGLQQSYLLILFFFFYKEILVTLHQEVKLLDSKTVDNVIFDFIQKILFCATILSLTICCLKGYRQFGYEILLLLIYFYFLRTYFYLKGRYFTEREGETEVFHSMVHSLSDCHGQS